jgi:hypothetical protein
MDVLRMVDDGQSWRLARNEKNPERAQLERIEQSQALSMINLSSK